MARASRDLPKLQGLLLVGGSAAYLLAIAAAAFVTVSMSARDNAASQKELARKVEPHVPGDLIRTPEVILRKMSSNPQQSRQEIALLVQKIRTQDQQDADGFVKSLIKERSDLQGLPFQMGGACRMTQESSNLFGMAVGITHASLRAEDTAIIGKVDSVDRFMTHWNGQDPRPASRP